MSDETTNKRPYQRVRHLEGYESITRIVEVTGIGRRTVWNWINAGEVKTTLYLGVKMVNLDSLRTKLGDEVFRGLRW